MQPHRQINHNDIFQPNVIHTVTLANTHSTLPDDGDHTETCCSYCNFNVNFNIPLKTILFYISW